MSLAKRTERGPKERQQASPPAGQGGHSIKVPTALPQAGAQPKAERPKDNSLARFAQVIGDPARALIIPRRVYMTWTKRIFLAAPFAIAATLTVLLNVGDKLHLRREHLAGYCFLFATPWSWLLDRVWIGPFQNRWLEKLNVYLVILWIPALLYACCLWVVLRSVQYWIAHKAPRAN